mmetsp:Transcript_1703/g.2743  ORF Transcript_1703/g.2743 Transcript_1703/m.2743 type:complete len:86 (-) Transcript_1703:283-540(-)
MIYSIILGGRGILLIFIGSRSLIQSFPVLYMHVVKEQSHLIFYFLLLVVTWQFKLHSSALRFTALRDFLGDAFSFAFALFLGLTR